jgi:N-acetylneuraminic acid mutarotase
MFQLKNAAILFGLCAALVACDGAPTRDLTAPDPAAGALDAQNVSLLAPSNTWTGKASLPGDRPRQGRSSLKASSLDNFIYVFGGEAPAGISARVDAYNITTNSWSPRAPLPSARLLLNGASTINRLIYVTGGFNSAFAFTKTLYVYNAATDSWVRKADMPQTGSCGAQGVIGGLLYVYVGCTNASNAHHLFRYNPATNIWVTRAAPPTRHVNPAAAGVITGKFYLAGGFSNVSTDNLTLDVYNPATNTWTTRAPLPGAQRAGATGVIGGKLFAAGGDAGTASPIGTLRVYDPATNLWTTKAPMPTPRGDAAGTPAAGLLFVIGGHALNSFTGRNEAYTP